MNKAIARLKNKATGEDGLEKVGKTGGRKAHKNTTQQKGVLRKACGIQIFLETKIWVNIGYKKGEKC